MAGESTVSLFYERPLRVFLSNGARRKEQVELPADQPFDALRDAVHERLDARFPLELKHGRRVMGSDEDLRFVLELTKSKDVDIMIRVAAAPDAELPPTPPLPPSLAPVSGPQQMLSFFKFSPLSPDERPVLQAQLRQMLTRLGARGTVYLAPEGMNAQLCVPLGAAEELVAELEQLKLGLEPNLAEVVAAELLPFDKLLVRERPQVLTDGLPTALDWGRAGKELTPREWHGAVQADGEGRRPLMLDCRNLYESEVGSFEGAEPVGTLTFSETWDTLRSRLDGVPSDTPIMTYCTGGIRCVKVNAFLEQSLGFSNTMRLQDGINGYLRFLREEQADDSAWRGQNFVFDKRTLVQPPADSTTGDGGGIEGEDDS